MTSKQEFLMFQLAQLQKTWNNVTENFQRAHQHAKMALHSMEDIAVFKEEEANRIRALIIEAQKALDDWEWECQLSEGRVRCSGSCCQEV